MGEISVIFDLNLSISPICGKIKVEFSALILKKIIMIFLRMETVRGYSSLRGAMTRAMLCRTDHDHQLIL